MTRHPPDSACDCDHCYVDQLNAVLRRFLEQRERRIEERKAKEIDELAQRLARAG